MRAIVSSGYSDEPVMARYEEYGFQEVIAKPYNIFDLGRILRVVLTSSLDSTAKGRMRAKKNQN